ncbi:FAD-dependent monooxygenase, partial [Mycobacterium sp. 1245852.3]|uniref:FAD-dependent monooxygenase n=1 Tax=Mycobacterium sp. 1245852.3 TaxID=1856860 RepID=UPI0009ED14DE
MSRRRLDVVIVGAGPSGLLLACELALAGVRPTVLERDTQPSDEHKANFLVGQVVRALDIRGLYRAITGDPGPPRPVSHGVFAGMELPLVGVQNNPLYALPIPQPQLVRLLVARARDLGVDVRWGHEVVEMEVDSEISTLTVAAPEGSYHLSARYLVGADGGRSIVRKRAGIGFPGVTMPTHTRIADVRIPDESRRDGGWQIPGFGRIPFGLNSFERGAIFYIERSPQYSSIITMEFDDEAADDTRPLTIDEMRHSVRRIIGVDVQFDGPSGPGPHALRRLNVQNTRQADQYRVGNILLVGDSAHVHPPIGGPGLNLGLQDAMNVGWKLAAEVKGWAPQGLLDTYYSERHPVGQRVMMHSLSQLMLITP